MRDKIAKNGQNSVFSILKSTPAWKSTPLLVLVVLTNMSYACCILWFLMFSSRMVFFPHVFYYSCSTSSIRQAPSSMLSRCLVAPPPPPSSSHRSPTQCSAQACFGWKILASCLFVGAAPGDRWPTFLPFFSSDWSALFLFFSVQFKGWTICWRLEITKWQNLFNRSSQPATAGPQGKGSIQK